MSAGTGLPVLAYCASQPTYKDTQAVLDSFGQVCLFVGNIRCRCLLQIPLSRGSEKGICDHKL